MTVGKKFKMDGMLLKLFQPFYRIAEPHIEGLEHISAQQPALYVANHTTLGVLDLPFFAFALHERFGINLRALAHRVFFKVPLWAAFMESIGAVEGTRQNCAMLMDQREHILVFPGGGAEVAKAKGQKYQLMWKERTGFVKMAAAHCYPIIPFASVGAEECYDIRLDRHDLIKTPMGRILKFLPVKFEEIPSVVSGWGGTLLPKPERFYFKFMPRIDTLGISPADHQSCLRIKGETQAAIETAIAELLKLREGDPMRYPLMAKLKNMGKWPA